MWRDYILHSQVVQLKEQGLVSSGPIPADPKDHRIHLLNKVTRIQDLRGVHIIEPSQGKTQEIGPVIEPTTVVPSPDLLIFSHPRTSTSWIIINTYHRGKNKVRTLQDTTVIQRQLM